MPTLTRSIRRAPVVVALVVGTLGLVAAPPVWADNVFPAPVKPPPKQSPPPNTLESQVRYDRSYNGPGPKMAPAAGADWSPPPCWYEPEFTPAQFENYLNSHYVSDQNAFASMAAQYGVDNYHKGEKGAWWELQVPDLSRAGECANLDDWTWIPSGKPPADIPAADARMLAGLAYAHTVLPGPPVTLRPVAGNQLVNLDTEVAFRLPLKRVSVTASLDNAAFGVHVAATTVAEPYELQVDAGTDYAQPRTCTYTLTDDGGTYSLDTHGDPCNVTYRKASPPGGYTMTASIVWKVHWTPSADPDGPPAAAPALPDGGSSAPTTVTVRENVALNR